jgi:hypothetical protein
LTLVYAAKDTTHNNAVALREVLMQRAQARSASAPEDQSSAA